MGGVSSTLAKTPEQKEIDTLVAKYSYYNKDYEMSKKAFDSGASSFNPKGPPQLLDAILSGMPANRYKTFSTYTTEIGKDIKRIVELMPDALHCELGWLRCRQNIFPLAMACLNTSIPLDIIQYLLDKGADPDKTYQISYEGASKISILEDMELHVTKLPDDMPRERYEEITRIFKEHKAKLGNAA